MAGHWARVRNLSSRQPEEHALRNLSSFRLSSLVLYITLVHSRNYKPLSCYSTSHIECEFFPDCCVSTFQLRVLSQICKTFPRNGTSFYHINKLSSLLVHLLASGQVLSTQRITQETPCVLSDLPFTNCQ